MVVKHVLMRGLRQRTRSTMVGALCLSLWGCTIGARRALPGSFRDAAPPAADGSVEGGLGADAGPILGDPGASPQVDGSVEADARADASVDATVPAAGIDTDGDGLDDATELSDDDPRTDPERFNGLLAQIGERPEGSGSCGTMDDWAEMTEKFAEPRQAMPVRAGWDFETDADDYDDPSYGFDPNWTEARGGRFAVRYTGRFAARETGRYCFAIDVGADGSGRLIDHNSCGQVYVNAGSAATQVDGWLVESGYSAEKDAHRACTTLSSQEVSFDIVLRYFNVLERNRLRVRYCFGGAQDCEPTTPVTQRDVLLP